MTVTEFNLNKEELSQNEWENEYQKNIHYWGKLRNNEAQINENMITALVENKIAFYVKLENDDPYKRSSDVMISLSLQYIGTNKFYGYVSKDFYGNLITK